MTSISRSGSSTSTTNRFIASADGPGRARRWRRSWRRWPRPMSRPSASTSSSPRRISRARIRRPAPRRPSTARMRRRAVEERADGDVAFAHAISGRPVVLGTFFTATPQRARKTSLTRKAAFPLSARPRTRSSPTSTARSCRSPSWPTPRAGLGFLNWLPDDDRVVRTVPLLLDINGQIQPSLAMETLRVAQGASGYVVKSTDAVRRDFRQEHRRRGDQGRRRRHSGSG